MRSRMLNRVYTVAFLILVILMCIAPGLSHAENVTVDITGITFYDSEDNELDYFRENQDVKADVCIYNPAEEDLFVQIFLAMYDGNSFVGLKAQSATLTSLSETVVTIPAKISRCTNIKCFVWKTETLYPYGEAVEFEPLFEQAFDTEAVSDFVLLSDSLTREKLNAHPKSKQTPLWTGIELFNSSTDEGYPYLENSTGTAWTGEEKWTDYSVSANVTMSEGDINTVLLSARHINTLYYGDSYYCAGIYEGNELVIAKCPRNLYAASELEILERCSFDDGYTFDGNLRLTVFDNCISLSVNDECLLSYTDEASVLTRGNVGIVACGATARISDFTVQSIYDKEGGHIDNYLKNLWDYPTENLYSLLTGSEKTEIDKSFEDVAYISPVFSFDLKSYSNEVSGKTFYTEYTDLERSGNYIIAQGGINVLGGSVTDDCSIELEIESKSDMNLVSSYAVGVDEALWSARIEGGSIVIGVGGAEGVFPFYTTENGKYHIVFSYDGSFINVYVNGSLSGSLECDISYMSEEFAFFKDTGGKFGNMRIYDLALRMDQVVMRYGDGDVIFGESSPLPAENLDFTRYVYNTSMIMENSGYDSSKVTLCDNFLAKKQYERTVYGQNVYFLDTLNSKRDMSIYIGDFGDSSLYKNSDELTVEFWANVSSPRNGQSHRLLSMSDANREEFAFEIYFSNEKMYFWGTEFNVATRSRRGKTLDMTDYVNKWCHYVFTRKYDAETNKWHVCFYADGVCLLSYDMDKINVDESGMRLAIASQSNGANDFWGYLGKASVYTSYFEQGQVNGLYRNGIKTFKSKRV